MKIINKLIFVVVLFFICIIQLQAQTVIPLNDPTIKYDGTWYSDIKSSKVIFGRITSDAYTNNESGYFDDYCRLWVKTQSGIRIRFKTNSPHINLTFESRADGGHIIDTITKGFNIFADGVEIMATANLSFEIANPKLGSQVVYEVSLPNIWSVNFTSFTIDNGYSLMDPGDLNKPVFVAIGNSISHGTGQYCESSKTWPFIFAKLLDWDLYNVAVAGANTGWATALNVKGKKVDHITVELGANEWYFYTSSLATVQTMYNRLIDSLRKFQPLAKIYCMSPSFNLLTSGSKAPYTLDELRNMIKTRVQTKQTTGDSLIYFINGLKISDSTMLDDEAHFNEYGAKKFAERIAAFIDSSKVQHGSPSDSIN